MMLNVGGWGGCGTHKLTTDLHLTFKGGRAADLAFNRCDKAGKRPIKTNKIRSSEGGGDSSVVRADS